MLLLLTVMAMLFSTAVAQTDADVLILGAGKAGLTAAKHLAEQNVSFLIIEGADEIGGRLKSTMFGGIKVGYGSSLIQGTNATVMELADKYNITYQFIDTQDTTVRTSSGTQPETEARAALTRLVQSQMKVQEIYRKIKEGKMSDMSLRTALEYGKWFPGNSIDDNREFFFYDLRFSKIPELVSTLEFYDRLEQGVTIYFTNQENGLQAMLERDFRDFMEVNDPRLKLNEVVNSISHTDSAVSVSTKSGKTFTGKYAIVTFSIGVLKSGSVTFDPVLPEWKLDTIYKMNMNPRTMIYVKFNSGITKFWDNTQFILHVSPRRGYYPFMFNANADGFYPAATNILSFVLLGEEARRVERLDKVTVKEEITQVLRNMYGSNIPEPEDIFVTKWLDDPLTRGSSSNKQVGDFNPRFMDALTSPVGRLYWAGEAYHDVLDGLVEGARLSGISTSMKLYDCMMNKNCHKFNPNPPQPTQKPPTCSASANTLSLAFLGISLVISLT